MLTVAPVPWGDHVGTITRPYRVTGTCVHIRPRVERWEATFTRVVQAINADDAMQLVEKELLGGEENDDCYGLAAELIG